MPARKPTHWKPFALAAIALLAGWGSLSAYAIETVKDPNLANMRDRERVTLKVDTVAELDDAYLIPLLRDRDGMAVLATGRDAEGDGGGQTFTYHTTGRPTADGGFSFNGPGADDWFEAVDQTRHYGPRWCSPTASAATQTTRLQAAIDSIYTAGRGILDLCGQSYEINAKLVVGSGVHICNGLITQQTDSTPVIEVSKAATNAFLRLENLELGYDDQQDSGDTGSAAIELASSSDTNYRIVIKHCAIDKPQTGIRLNNLSGATAFLVAIEDVTVNSYSLYGLGWFGDLGSGARTTLKVDQFWCVQSVGSEIATSKGVAIYNTQNIDLRNIAIDHAQSSRVIDITSCQGWASNLRVESCDFSASSGAVDIVSINASKIAIEDLHLVDNNVTLTGSGEGNGVLIQGASKVTIHNFAQGNTTVSDSSSASYFDCQASSASADVQVLAYSTSGATPAFNVSDAGTAALARAIKRFGGNWRFIPLLPLAQARVHDNMAALLPSTAAADDMAIITGTPGTDAPTLQGVDFGGTSTDEKCAFEYLLPPDYPAGASFYVVPHCAMLTTVSSSTATIDVECWETTAAGAVGSDLCTTAAQSMNSLTPADKYFLITGTNLVPGDRIIIRLSFGGSDGGDAGVMIPEISRIILYAP